MAKRPLVEATIRTEFGDVLDSPDFYDVSGADRDLSYVPGFSEMRRARDRALADVAQGRKDKRDVVLEPLPVNVRWTRSADVRGAPDARKQIGAGNLGYKSVSEQDVGNPWLTSLPPGATVAADGSIRKGDTMLMVADGKTAARNAARKAALTKQMTRDVAAAKGGLIDVGSRAPGVDPFVREEPSSAAEATVSRR